VLKEIEDYYDMLTTSIRSKFHLEYN